ncbi:hypothetical protein LCGC14_2641640 [marine sediment metagenome]|uniref:Uncharacterized protein n=1 Tax=marine sediment metagenome TaxID=412755 RepID=A0A0F8ZX95_9ZZZZ
MKIKAALFSFGDGECVKPEDIEFDVDGPRYAVLADDSTTTLANVKYKV